MKKTFWGKVLEIVIDVVCFLCRKRRKKHKKKIDTDSDVDDDENEAS